MVKSSGNRERSGGFNNNNNNNNKKNSVNISDDGKTLSRNALYAPLVAYEQTTGVEPSDYMISKSSVPKSLRESSLSVFLQKVSHDYHRNQATASDPKNNGSRPLSVKDVDDRIRQRAVTLIGGGINSSMTSSKTASKKRQTTKKPRKRKRREWKQVEQIMILNSNSKDGVFSSSSKTKNSKQFLRQLNASWNEYISSVLQLKACSSLEEDVMTIKARFVVARENMELIGAHVQVATCSQRKPLIGTMGVLTGETKKTWQMAQLKMKSKKAVADGAAKDGDKKVSDEPMDVKIITVPKRGSTLVLMLPLGSPSKDSDDGNGIAQEESHIVVVEELIPQSDQPLCITIDPSRL